MTLKQLMKIGQWRPGSSRRGFTAAEAVVVAGAMSVLLLGFSTLLVSSGSEWSSGSARLSADNRASLSMQTLSRAIRSASTATTGYSGAELIVRSPTVTTTGDYDRSTQQTTTTRYYLGADVLYEQTGTAQPIPLGKGITAFSCAVSGDRVTIRLTASDQSGSKIKESTLETETTLRNPLVR